MQTTIIAPMRMQLMRYSSSALSSRISLTIAQDDYDADSEVSLFKVTSRSSGESKTSRAIFICNLIRIYWDVTEN